MDLQTQQKTVLSDYLAAERTLLAWIRTGLALMGFGFVVARFGLFLQQLDIARNASAGLPSGFSLWFGTALIGASVVVNLLSAWHHVRLVRSIDPARAGQLHSTTLAVSTSVFLALVGLAMAIYLISVSTSANSQPANGKQTSMAQSAQASVHEIVDMPTNHSAGKTVKKLRGILESRGITLFVLIDHSREAEKVGENARHGTADLRQFQTGSHFSFSSEATTPAAYPKYWFTVCAASTALCRSATSFFIVG